MQFTGFRVALGMGGVATGQGPIEVAGPTVSRSSVSS